MSDRMMVFQIQDNDDARIVEAPTFEAAILAWQREMVIENPGTEPADFILHSVTKICDEPVIR